MKNDVQDIKKQLGKLDMLEKQLSKLDVLDKWVEERRLLSVEKKPAGDTQGSGVASNTIGKARRVILAEQTPPVTQRQTRSESPENSAPLTRKIELPTFDGENADDWVVRVEQYFELQAFTAEEKIRAVRMCFEGDALSWYHWERDRNPFVSWEQMKDRVLENFSTVQDLTPGERLLLLRQHNTVGQFCKEFIALASNAPEVS